MDLFQCQMDNQRQSQINAGRGGGLRRMNTDAGPLRSQSVHQDPKLRRNTCSTDKPSINQLGKSTLRVLTKKTDNRRASASRRSGTLDRSSTDRSAKSDGFIPLDGSESNRSAQSDVLMPTKDARRSSVEKRLRKQSSSCDNVDETFVARSNKPMQDARRKRSSSCDNMEETFAAHSNKPMPDAWRTRSSSCDNMDEMLAAQSNMKADSALSNRVSSADNLAEMIAISREALFYNGENSGGFRPRQTQTGVASRRNTYKEPNRAHKLKDDGANKPRRTTYFGKQQNDQFEYGGTSLRVPTKMKDNPQGSSAQFRASGASIASAKSDGKIVSYPDERKAPIRTGKMPRRRSSLDNPSETAKLNEIIVSHKQTRLPHQKHHEKQEKARRSTVKYPPRKSSDADPKLRRNTVPVKRNEGPIEHDKLSRNTYSDGTLSTQNETIRNRPMYSRKRSSSLDETRDVKNVKMSRVKSSNALELSYIGQDKAVQNIEKAQDEKLKTRRNTASVRKKCQQMGKVKRGSANSLGDLQAQEEVINERPNYARKRSSSLDKLDEMLGTKNGPDKPVVYDHVLLDLFSSIAGTSQSQGFKNSEVSISDRDLSNIDQAFSRQNSSLHSSPSPNGIPKPTPEQFKALIEHTQMPLTSSNQTPRLHHKRTSSGDVAVAPDRVALHEGQPLQRSTRSTPGDLLNARGNIANDTSITVPAETTVAQKEIQHASAPQAKTDAELQLYDDISRSSDPKIGKWIGEI